MGLSTPSRDRIYDEVRNLWVVATPEEVVRQNLLKKMIYELSYPRELISVEKALSEIPFFASIPAPMRRIDVACFAPKIHPKHALYPLLLIECKEDRREAEKAWQQVQGYNSFLKACFLAVAYPEGELFGFLEGGELRLLSHLPSYLQLMQAIGHGKYS
ncbi:MAG: type I restriction enzyme HsdR N-terminal domain-containing protein [Rhabdochlamydiaceae bacterium]|nr:type I restriction enzyme HsdR N-terminal domain-containing protein [Rhabdochlamydiaceae bacterium]